MLLRTPPTKLLAIACLLSSFLSFGNSTSAEEGAEPPAVVCPDDVVPPLPDNYRHRDWVELAKRIGTDTDNDDLFGQSVAIDGNYAIVGASEQATGGIRSGAVYIYRLGPGGWVEEAKLLPDDPASGMNFGYYVDIEGENAIIGAHRAQVGGSDRGAVYMFTRSGTTWTQQQKLAASDGQSTDYFGHGVRLDGNLAVIGAYGVGADRGAAYVFSFDGTTWIEQQKLTGDELGDGNGVINGDRFGFSVSIDAGTVVVGADQFRTPGGPHGGTAYIYVDVNGTWTQQAKLEAEDTEDRDRLGFTVDIFGDYAIAGARHEDTGGGNAGAAYVFKRTGTSWAQQAKLQPQDITANDNFGINVTINNGLVAVGAFNESTKGSRAGAAYVYELDGTVWKEQTKLLASDGAANDLFGRSISIDHGRIIASSNHQGSAGTDAGAIYFFGPAYTLDPLIYPVCTGSTTVPAPTATDNCDGTVTATTTDPVAFSAAGTYTIEWVYTDAAGNKVTATQYVSLIAGLSGPVPIDAVSREWKESMRVLDGDPDRVRHFGTGVAIDGDIAVVSIGNEDAAESGAAYVYLYSEGNWVQIDELLAPDAGADEAFGYSVAISGDWVAVGAHTESVGATSPGAVYLYERDGLEWNFAVKIESPENPATDYFGFSVALSGDRLLVGAPEDLSAGTTTGAAYVFERGSGDWSAFTKLLASDGAAGDEFGYSVAIDGDFLIVGAGHEDTDGTDSGAAYVFEHDGTDWAQAAKLKANYPEAGATFGHDVSISGARLVIGADSDGQVADNSGVAYVFDRGFGDWSTQRKLTASDAAQNDFFGRGVAISGNRILVGADRVGSNTLEAGAAYVFDYELGSWQEQAKLIPSEVEGFTNFGNRVALSGDRLLVGAPNEDADFVDAGAAYFFTLRAELAPVLLSNCKPTVAETPDALSSCGDAVVGKTSDPVTYGKKGDYEILWIFTDPNGNVSVATQEVNYVEVTVRIPYSDPFIKGTPERDCWETVDVANDGGWRTSDDPTHSKSGVGAYFLPPSAVGQDDRLFSPVLNFAAGLDYHLAFDHRALGAATEHLRVYLVDANNGNEVKQLFADDKLTTDYTNAPLVIDVPANGNYRVAFESQSAAGSQGILLDNFIIVPEFAPSDGAAQLVTDTDDDNCLYSFAPGLNGFAWTTLIGSGGKRLVEINSNGNDLGDVVTEMTDYSSPPLSPFLNERVMSRYFDITPEKGKGPYTNNGGVKVRMYFTDAELAEFNTARGFNADWSDLIITHYDGTDEDCTIDNSIDEDFDLLLQTRNRNFGNNAHYVEFLTTSFSEFGATSAQGFPVVLTAFTARAEGKGNLLEWHVATEIDFSHYTVQRSTDGVGFTDLGRVDGTKQARYSLTDLAPAALQYYRLRMVDHDGSFALSPVVSVTRSAKNNDALSLHPVPTSDRLTLTFSAKQRADHQLVITDALGRTVDKRRIPATAGANRYDLSLDGLPSGTYHVTLRGGGTLLHARAVKR